MPPIMYFNKWLTCVVVTSFVLPRTTGARSLYKSERNLSNSRGCSFIKCGRNEQCVDRKFACKIPPCPNMSYCAKSQTELLNGPTTCNSVKCTKGHVCVITIRRCNWNGSCQDRIARCITEREYYDGPASCIGFKCPSGQRCILRESLCQHAPCKLLKSCANKQEVHAWLDTCKSLGCISEYECFLRRPRENCKFSSCQHTPDCTATTLAELFINEKCNGWICPKGQRCAYQVQSPCLDDSCRITRSCHGQLIQRNDSSTINAKHYEQFASRRFLSDKPLLHSTTKAPGTLILPNLTSVDSWLNYFGLGTNIDAIEYLMQEAKEQPGYNDVKFLQWLKTMKDTIGEKAYNHWLDNVLINVTDNEAIFRAFDWENNSPSFRSSLTKNTKDSPNTAKSEVSPSSVVCADRSENVSSEKDKQTVLSNVWRQLKEEHHIYLKIINKTDELLSTVKQLKPVSNFENILKSVQESSPTRRILNTPDVISKNKNTSTNQFSNGKLSNVSANDYSKNDTNFFIVDYEESAEINVNHSIPRLIIRVENNMNQPIKIGNINLKYEDDNLENVTQSVYDQSDYYVDEFQYFKTPNNSAITDKYQ